MVNKGHFSGEKTHHAAETTPLRRADLCAFGSVFYDACARKAAWSQAISLSCGTRLHKLWFQFRFGVGFNFGLSFFSVEVSVSVSITLSARLRHQAGTSQALCTPVMKIADNLKLFALSGHSTHDNWRTSPGLWARIMKLPTVSGSEHFLRTPCTKLGGRLRLSAPPCWKLPTASGSEQSSHDKRRTSQALCTRMMKLPTVSGSEHCLGTPFTEIEERFGLCAPPG